MNEAAINIVEKVSLWKYGTVPFGYMPKSGTRVWAVQRPRIKPNMMGKKNKQINK